MGWCHSTQKSCTQTYFTLWQHAQHLRQDWAMFSFFCVVVSIAFLSTYGGRYLLSSSTCNRSFFCVIKIHSHWIISICKRLFCISTSPAEEGKKRSKGFFPCRLWKCLSASYDSGTLSSQGKSHWQNCRHNFIREALIVTKSLVCKDFCRVDICFHKVKRV